MFCRRDSIYKALGADCYDIDRDALTFPGGKPVVAHPPCRAWASLAHMAKPRHGERDLALRAVEQVRKNGGVLEHPERSRLFREAGLPLRGRDEFGGFVLFVDQWWWGHPAKKPTLLYICGIEPRDVPVVPMRIGVAAKTVTGIKGQPGRRCSDKEREATPTEFARWLLTLAMKARCASAVSRAAHPAILSAGGGGAELAGDENRGTKKGEAPNAKLSDSEPK